MKDAVDAGVHDIEARIADVSTNELAERTTIEEQIVEVPVAHVVEQNYVVTLEGESLPELRSHEPRASSDENSPRGLMRSFLIERRFG
jgi:hypothetical protein